MEKAIVFAGVFLLGGYLALNNPEIADLVTSAVDQLVAAFNNASTVTTP